MTVITVYSAPFLDQEGHSCCINEGVAASTQDWAKQPSGPWPTAHLCSQDSALEGLTAVLQCFYSLLTSLQGIPCLLTWGPMGQLENSRAMDNRSHAGLHCFHNCFWQNSRRKCKPDVQRTSFLVRKKKKRANKLLTGNQGPRLHLGLCEK